MSNIRLFYPESLSINLEGKLDKAQSHYLTKAVSYTHLTLPTILLV